MRISLLPPLAKRPPLPEARFSFIDLFAGIGGMRIAFEEAGGRCVFTSEWDEYARRTYTANFPTDGHSFAGDITKVPAEAVPAHDVLLAGFPCQPFSIAGVSKNNALGREHGFLHATQGTLFFETARIIAHHRPRAFLLENVRNLVTHDRKRTLQTILATLSEELGYLVSWRVIDAAALVPQHRERIYIVGFRDAEDALRFDFPKPGRERPLLSSILDAEADPRYTLTPHLWGYLQEYAAKHRAKGNGFGFGLISLADQANPDVVTRTLSARYYKDGSEILIEREAGPPPRRLAPHECARLMGFPEWFTIPVSDTRAYKQFGNSVAVPVVQRLAEEIAACLESTEKRLPPEPGRQMRMLLREESEAFVAVS